MIDFKLTDDREWYKQVVSGVFLSAGVLFNIFLILIGSLFIYIMIKLAIAATAMEFIGFIGVTVGAFVGAGALAYTYLWSTGKLPTNEQES
jgi:hypothetical protein